MNYSAYEQELTRLMIVYAVEFGALVIALALIFWRRTRKIWKSEETGAQNQKQKMRFGDYLCLILMVSSLMLGLNTIWKYQHDIQNQAYIAWEGTFTVEDGGRVSYWYLPDKSGVELQGDTALPEGRYNGTVIYGEKTKIVLDYFANDNP